jgi:hypothetical protein
MGIHTHSIDYPIPPTVGQNFDLIKIRITNCASNLQRARQREDRGGQIALRPFGFFHPDEDNTNPAKIKLI